jgi:gamma-carbonic anhydrase
MFNPHPVVGSGPIYTLGNVTPKIHPSAWIAPTAAVIGDVEIGLDCGIWFHCVLRGDTNFIRIGARTNIQDGTIIHVDARTRKDRAFVGMGATVLDGAVIHEGGMLAAGGLLTPNKVIGPNELWAGSPAQLKRVMSEEERAGFDQTAPHYVELAARMRVGLRGAG